MDAVAASVDVNLVGFDRFTPGRARRLASLNRRCMLETRDPVIATCAVSAAPYSGSRATRTRNSQFGAFWIVAPQIAISPLLSWYRTLSVPSSL